MLNPPVTLFAQSFRLEQIRSLRHAVARHAAAAGLSGRRLTDFVTAVNEIASNAIEHGGGGGHLRLWLVGGLLCGEVTDEGQGIPPGHTIGAPPSPAAVRGRGLWLAHCLCDEVAVASGPDGTTVRVTTRIREDRVRNAG